MLGCRVLGHRVRFWAEGRTMWWECERDCGYAGHKDYATEAEARRMARVLDHEDAEDIGRRPTPSLMPIWLARKMADRDRHQPPSGA